MNSARRKQYVEVVATHYIDGSVRPQKIVLATGPVYEIQDSREAAPGKAHTTGEIARREAHGFSVRLSASVCCYRGFQNRQPVS